MTAFALSVLVGNASHGGRFAGGAVIRDDEGRMLRRTARLLGEVSRAEAVYRTVLTGLWQARDLGVNRIEVLVSDPDVAAQLGGDTAVPSSLIGVYLQVRAMLRAYRWSAVTPVDSLRTAEAATVPRRALDRNVDEANLDSLPPWIPSDRAWVT